jgi:hypothetical protein
MNKILLLLLSSVNAAYSMIGQPMTYAPARTPYWYRSQQRSQEQARIKKYSKKINKEKQRMNQAIQMREYEPNAPTMMQENPEYMLD